MDQNQLRTCIKNNTLAPAIVELEQEREVALARNDTAQAAVTMNDLGVVYSYAGQREQARGAFKDAQALFLRVEDPAGQGRAAGNLAQLEERAGNPDEALGLYMQAADLLHEGKAFEDEYTTRRRLSKFYLTRGAALQALHETTKALGVKPNPGVWDRFQRFFYRLPLQMMGLDID